MRALLLVLALLLVAAPAASAQLGDPGYVPTGEIVADTGFRPDVNGFSFENYGEMEGVRNLGAAEMRALFGSRVCVRLVNGSCKLTPVARAWMEDENEGMSGGHCYGFAMMSQLIYKDLLPSSREAGMPTGPASGMKLNPKLQRNLAYTFVWQGLDSVLDRTIGGTPKEVLEKAIEVLRPDNREIYGLGFYARDGGGHEITPYAVESKGNGQYVILTYDNNWPGRTSPFYVDTVANTWRYDLSAGNPEFDPEVWDGDAKTKTVTLDPTTPGIGVQPCPFCEGAKLQFNTVKLDSSPTNHPNLLIQDRFKRRVGWVGDKLVNEIPGAKIVQPVTAEPWQDKPEPEYRIPVSGGGLTVKVDGRRLKKRSKADVRVLGPGYFSAVEDISVTPGDVDTMTVGARGDRLRYKTKRTESPNVGLAFDRGGVSWNFAALSYDVKSGAVIDFSVDKKKGRVHFSSDGAQGNYSIVAFQDTKRTSLDWGATYEISGEVKASIAYNRRIRDENGKPGIPITWTEDTGLRYTESLDRDYQDE